MLPREHRLKGKKTFDEIKKHGTFQHTSTLIIGVLNRGDVNPSRFGIVVSKKVSNKAVVRNKVKRVIKKVVGNYLNKVKKGSDVLIIAKSSVKDVNENGVDVIIKNALQRFNLTS